MFNTSKNLVIVFTCAHFSCLSADCFFLDTESSRKLRETFAKACFETLLQFSFVIRSAAVSSQDDGAITQLAVLSLLDRCKSVLVKFVADERLSGKCPLPRFTACSLI